MLPETIRSSPSTGDYIPLSEYQSQTPESFHGGKPVLYYHGIGAKACIPKSQRGSLPFFPADFESEPTGPIGGEAASARDESSESQVEQLASLYVTSENLIIFCPGAGSGLSIPYPSITLHAIKTVGSDDQKIQAVYLQLEFSDGGADDETYDTVELTIVPAVTPETSAADSGSTPPSEASKLFEAISECSNLHPDPVEEEEDDDSDDRIVFEGDHEAVEGLPGVFQGSPNGGLPPPMPGSSGWITAENVHEYFDGEGNWIGERGAGGDLGQGAGAVHEREDAAANANGVNGHADSNEGDAKRPRTE